MKCELCGAETGLGHPYRCFYGKRIGSNSYTQALPGNTWQTTTTITYHMGGEKSAWYCDRCMAFGCGIRLAAQSLFCFFLTFLFIILTLVMLLVFPHQTITSIMVIFAILSFSAWFFFLFWLAQGLKALSLAYGDPQILHAFLGEDPSKGSMLSSEYLHQYGDAMLLKREKAELRKAGYDGFFTRRNKPAPKQAQG